MFDLSFVPVEASGGVCLWVYAILTLNCARFEMLKSHFWFQGSVCFNVCQSSSSKLIFPYFSPSLHLLTPLFPLPLIPPYSDSSYPLLTSRVLPFLRLSPCRTVLVSLTSVVVLVISTDWISWDHLNRGFLPSDEVSRAFLASFILVFDLLIVMQVGPSLPRLPCGQLE